jgi:hypothetical protein
MFIVGETVICRDGSFNEEIKKLYIALPVEGQSYVVRGVCPAYNSKMEPEIGIYLIGLLNPKSAKPPFPERSFNSERFVRPAELTEEEILALGQSKEKELVEK